MERVDVIGRSLRSSMIAGSFHKLPNTLSWTLYYSTNIPVTFTFQGASGGKWLSYPALCYRETNILDKTQGSFQKGVILFKSVIKASLIRLLIAACFLVVARNLQVIKKRPILMCLRVMCWSSAFIGFVLIKRSSLKSSCALPRKNGKIIGKGGKCYKSVCSYLWRVRERYILPRGDYIV